MKRLITYIAIALSVLLPCLPKAAFAQIPSAETNAAPASAQLSQTAYVVWMGKNMPGSVWFTTSNGSGGWNSQQEISNTLTTKAPALVSINENELYLAWRGPSTGATDQIYFTTNTGSGWSSTHSTICNGSICAATTAAPALAANGSTLYAAWTTASNTVEFGTYSGGAWTFITTPAATNANTAPALAVYEGNVFLAWVAAGSSQVMSASMPVSGGTWSALAATPAVTTVAPALGVFVNAGTTDGPAPGLYLAWTSGGSIDYADWDDGWSAAVPVPGLPKPPGPLSPALVDTAMLVTPGCTKTVNAFTVLYDYTASPTYQGIDYVTLSEGVSGGCVPPCHGTACF